MQKWEYMTIEVKGDNTVRKVNGKGVQSRIDGIMKSFILLDDFLLNIGEEGWELVMQLNGETIIAKRPKP